MSAEHYLEIMVDGQRVIVWDGNITYNLTPMLTEAGYPGHRAVQGAPASELGGMLNRVHGNLTADPDLYKALSPPNGWGTYEGAVEWVAGFRDACAKFPSAFVESWL